MQPWWKELSGRKRQQGSLFTTMPLLLQSMQQSVNLLLLFLFFWWWYWWYRWYWWWYWWSQDSINPYSLQWRSFSFCSIPHICHRHHRWCLCKKKLPGVNFYRFNVKNWQFTVYFVVIYAFFGANFILQKFCMCKKNDKYEVWCMTERLLISIV